MTWNCRRNSASRAFSKAIVAYFCCAGAADRACLTDMSRRVRKKKSPLLGPAENLMRRLSDTDARLRRKIVRYGLWAFGLIFLYSVMVGTYSIPRIIRLHWERSALLEANQKKLAQIIDSEMIRDRLLSDPVYIEMIARTQYYLIRPGETIYRYRGQ